MNISQHQSIFLQRANSWFLSGQVKCSDQDRCSDEHVASVIRNVEEYGYCFSGPFIEKMKEMSVEQLKELLDEIEVTIVKIVGADKDYRPMYAGFPKEVMEETAATLYINAIMHYITFGKWAPDSVEPVRGQSALDYELTVIDLKTEDEYLDLMKNLLGSKTSISYFDKQDLEAVIRDYDVKRFSPDEIPFKETRVFYVSQRLKNGQDLGSLKSYFKTATDVLRLAQELSMTGKHFQEFSRPIFKKFSRSERRMLLALLDECSNIEEDMLRDRGLWRQLGKALHPSDYPKFKRANRGFGVVYDQIGYKTFASKVEQAIQERDAEKIVKLLGRRPGEYARKLHEVLKKAGSEEERRSLVNGFKEVASRVSSPVLFQLLAFWRDRLEKKKSRIVLPKGSISNIYRIVEADPVELDESLILELIAAIRVALTSKYALKEGMGKVYVNQSMKRYPIPFSQRSASKSIKTVSRGSRILVGDDVNTIRAFLFWKDKVDEYGSWEADLDLSVGFFNKDWLQKDMCSYLNLRDETKDPYYVHSGDLVDGPEGACEYIDINIANAKAKGIAYAVVYANNYTNNSFADLGECFAGVAGKKEEDPSDGKLLDYRAMENKFDLSGNFDNAIIAIIDLNSMDYYWADMAVPKEYVINSFWTHRESIKMAAESIMDLSKATLYDLFELNARARGLLVDSPLEADLIISEDGHIKPTDYERVVGEFL